MLPNLPDVNIKPMAFKIVTNFLKTIDFLMSSLINQSISLRVEAVGNIEVLFFLGGCV
jgi:hypothetical protein